MFVRDWISKTLIMQVNNHICAKIPTKIQQSYMVVGSLILSK